MRRTFRRTAKNGIVKADGRLWSVHKNGELYSGPIVLRLNCANEIAYEPVSRVKAIFLTLTFIKRVHETGV